MNQTDVEELKVHPVGDQKFIHIPNGRGEEPRLHLASHGIRSIISPAAETPSERLEADGDADAVALQAILNKWER